MFRRITLRCKQRGMSLRTISSSAESQLKTIGFIGLGNMGSRMSANLLKKGYKVRVNDLNVEACKKLEEQGAEIVGNTKHIAREVDCLITMLPATQNVISLYNRDNGIGNDVRPGTVVIDCSTIDPSAAVAVAKEFKIIGAHFVDAPVSGGIIAAENATLTFMVGGNEEDAEKAKPVLSAMGSNIIHCGPSGAGLVAKICNNLLLGISMSGVSEAMNLGIKLGLEPSILAKVINSSSGRCWSSDTYNPVPGIIPGVPSSNEYRPGFTVKMITKDLNIAKRAAEDGGIPFEMGTTAWSLYEILSKSDTGNLDFSVIYKYFKDKS